MLHGGWAKLRAGARSDGFHVKTWGTTPALHMGLSTVRHNFIVSFNLSETFPEHMETIERPVFFFRVCLLTCQKRRAFSTILVAVIVVFCSARGCCDRLVPSSNTATIYAKD